MAEAFKDIVLPICQITSTIIVGGVVAFYLNRRTNKDKVKGLLIDSYVEYLKLYKNFHIYESNSISSSIYKKLLESDDNHMNTNIEQGIKKAIEERGTNNDINWFNENANISFSTYKFAFLLGAKKYSEKLQPFEDKWVRHLQSFDDRQQLITSITIKIANDADIMIAKQKAKTSDYLIRVEKIIDQSLEVDMFKDFNNYNTAVANEIDAF